MTRKPSAGPLRNVLRYAKRRLIGLLNRTRPIEQVFTEIYEKRHWGGDGDFSSGGGSRTALIVETYVSAVREWISRNGMVGSVFVDLGCGDFAVGSRLCDLAGTYIGVDVVSPLVQRNREKFIDPKLRFEHLNLCEDPLPDGRIAFLRQVLQHLSNNEILAILPKLKKYEFVFVTEHYPSAGCLIRPNRDKSHGAGIRIYDGSGVYLDKPPFDIHGYQIVELCSVEGHDLGPGHDRGVIRTFVMQCSTSE